MGIISFSLLIYIICELINNDENRKSLFQDNKLSPSPYNKWQFHLQRFNSIGTFKPSDILALECFCLALKLRYVNQDGRWSIIEI